MQSNPNLRNVANTLSYLSFCRNAMATLEPLNMPNHSSAELKELQSKQTNDSAVWNQTDVKNIIKEYGKDALSDIMWMTYTNNELCYNDSDAVWLFGNGYLDQSDYERICNKYNVSLDDFNQYQSELMQQHADKSMYDAFMDFRF